MGRINVLGFEIANLIAAGEVVDRPASVVKELCENSIDAGATTVTVEIRHGGVTYIRVSDNGCGIDPDDVPLTVLRHATSKIKCAEDLASIGTLGFRGEALAAISSVCKMKMVSRIAEYEMGCSMICDAGEIIDICEAGCAVGTTVIVSELFYNVPARRKFLKKDNSEGAAVTAVMEKIALSSPGVSIRYTVDGEVKFITTGDGDPLGVIYSVFGKETASRMTPVDRVSGEGIKIKGYIGEPDLVRGNKNSENFFINGRFIKSRTAMAALEQAYTGRIPSQKYPVCVLNIILDPSKVDVNVHPSKLEVKFANERIVFEAVYYAVLNALESPAERPEFMLPGKEKEPPKYPFTPFKSSNTSKKSVADAFVPVERAKEDRPDKAQIRIPAPEREETPPYMPEKREYIPASPPVMPKTNGIPKKSEPPAAQPCVPEEREAPTPKAKIPEYRIIGEAYNCYVIVELSDRILLIDKHAAHERILFDELCRRMKEKTRRGQMLLYPLTVPVSDEEKIALDENYEEIRSIGFGIQYDEKKRAVFISEIPEELSRDAAESMISSLLSGLSEATDSVESAEARFFEAKLYQASCKAAIKGGRVYDTAHIKWICDRLLCEPDEKGSVIKVCPHGRPVAFEIKKNSIDRQFDRIN